VKSSFRESGIKRGIPALLSNITKYKIIYLMMLPGILYFLIFHYLPMGGLIIAFKDYNIADGFWGSPFAGIEHFIDLFTSYAFFRILRNTIIISSYNLIFWFPGPIILAILLNEIRHALFKRTIQTIVYFPHFLSWVVVGGIVFRFVAPDGIINNILISLGLESQMFLTSTKYFRSIIVTSAIWKEIGWGTIIYLATISGINPELYQAAYVDGANRLQQIRHITIPGLLNTMIIVFIIRLGRVLDVGFEQIFMLYNPFVYEVADVIPTYIYRVGIQGINFSYTAAIGMFQSIIGLIFVVNANKLARSVGDRQFGIW